MYMNPLGVCTLQQHPFLLPNPLDAWDVMGSFVMSVPVKEFWKSVRISCSYGKNLRLTFCITLY